jgi:hypothetical protein
MMHAGMATARRMLLWSALTGMLLVMALSIAGAFTGGRLAGLLFNSPVMAVVWTALILLLIAALLEVPALVRRGGLLTMHAGALFVIAGAMWGSHAGHRLQAELLGIDKVADGQMFLRAGRMDDEVLVETPYSDLGWVERLPFAVKLERVSLEHYPHDGSPGGATLRACKTAVVILREGREEARKVIQVNDPLHWGGYHFHQIGHDEVAQSFAILRVKSDSGLYAVYIGFVLVCAGAVWQFWARPVLSRVRKGAGGRA